MSKNVFSGENELWATTAQKKLEDSYFWFSSWVQCHGSVHATFYVIMSRNGNVADQNVLRLKKKTLCIIGFGKTVIIWLITDHKSNQIYLNQTT